MENKFDDKTGRSQFFDNVDKELSVLIDPQTGKIKSNLVERVNCPVCEGEKYEHLFIKQGFDFVRCSNCKLVYINPRLLESETLAYYGEAPKENQDGQQSMSDWLSVLTNPLNQAWQIPYFEEAVNILSKYIPATAQILDIGCSIGLFMEIAQKSGFQCLGLEPEPKSRAYALSRGLNVRPDLFIEAGFPPNSFNAITMFGVLEHLNDPKKMLSDIWDCLMPGGVVMVIVPNVYSLANGTLHAQGRTFTGRNHLSYFSWGTISELFTRSGYEALYLDTCLTGLDAILNYWQFEDPHSGLSLDLLPSKMKNLLQDSNGRRQIEKLILDWDMGLRLRFAAKKPR